MNIYSYIWVRTVINYLLDCCMFSKSIFASQGNNDVIMGVLDYKSHQCVVVWCFQVLHDYIRTDSHFLEKKLIIVYLFNYLVNS